MTALVFYNFDRLRLVVHIAVESLSGLGIGRGLFVRDLRGSVPSIYIHWQHVRVQIYLPVYHFGLFLVFIPEIQLLRHHKRCVVRRKTFLTQKFFSHGFIFKFYFHFKI